MFSTPAMTPPQGQPVPDRFLGFYDSIIGSWQVPGALYTSKKGTQRDFWRWRASMRGGRANY